MTLAHKVHFSHGLYHNPHLSHPQIALRLHMQESDMYIIHILDEGYICRILTQFDAFDSSLQFHHGGISEML